jgi:hypothetical protein
MVTSDSLIFIPSFVKIDQIVQKLDGETTICTETQVTWCSHKPTYAKNRFRYPILMNFSQKADNFWEANSISHFDYMYIFSEMTEKLKIIFNNLSVFHT